jgi:hypothetical protein
MDTNPPRVLLEQLIFIVLDVLKPLGDLKILQAELEGVGIRLNKKPPQITVKKKDKGGVRATSSTLHTDRIVRLTLSLRCVDLRHQHRTAHQHRLGRDPSHPVRVQAQLV